MGGVVLVFARRDVEEGRCTRELLSRLRFLPRSLLRRRRFYRSRICEEFQWHDAAAHERFNFRDDIVKVIADALLLLPQR
jgi:hypothetical protein